MTNPGKLYEEYAEMCLRIAVRTPDRSARLILREMAAEWLQLSNGAAAPSRPERLDGHAPKPDGHARNRDLSN